MGQIHSIAERQSGFPPFSKGREVMFLYEDRDKILNLVNGFIDKLTPKCVVIDDINVDGSTTRHTVPQHSIVERFM